MRLTKPIKGMFEKTRQENLNKAFRSSDEFASM